MYKKTNNEQMENHQLTSFQTRISSLSIGNSSVFIFIIINFLLISNVCSDPTVIITSDLSYVGVQSNYNFTISNHANPNKIIIQFTIWSPWQNYSFSGNSQLTFPKDPQSSCFYIPVSYIYQCTIATNSVSATSSNDILLRLTLVNNPSSTKPYNINFNFYYDNGSFINVSAYLTISQINISPISLSNYSTIVDSNSPNVSWLVAFKYYFDYTTILQISYNNKIIDLNFDNLIGANVLNTSIDADNNTVVLISNWTTKNQGSRLINYIGISNPPAVFSYTFYCVLYYEDSGQKYLIQNYTVSLNFIPLTYSSYNASTLQMGLSNQIFTINSLQCSANATNSSSTNPSYMQVSFSLLDIPYSNCVDTTCVNSNCSSTDPNSKVCVYNIQTKTITIDQITQSIEPTPSSIFTVSLYIYFQPLSTYFLRCTQSYQVIHIPQQLNQSNISLDLSKCGNGEIIQQNKNMTLVIQNCNVSNTDIVTINGLVTGGSVGPGWVQVNGTNNFMYTVNSAQINNCIISIPLNYTNPTYLTTTDALTNITISRIFNSTSLIYLAISDSSPFTIPLCNVTIPISLNLVNFGLSSYLTYEQNVTCTIQFRNKLSDYSELDYLSIVFQYYDNMMYLTNQNIKSSLSSNSSTTNNNFTVVNDTVINIRNLTLLNKNVNNNSTLKISNLMNPATVQPIVRSESQAFNIIITLMSSSDTAKQQTTIKFSNSTTQTYSYQPTQLQLSQSIPLPILTTTGITFNFSNKNRNNYNRALISILSISLPFSCGIGGKTSNSSLSMLNQSLSIPLSSCLIENLVSNNATLNALEYIAVSNSSSFSLSTSTSYNIKLSCKDYCQICTSNQQCTKCANSTYFIYNFLYNGQCSQFCPSSTYRQMNELICSNCHPTCLNCSGPQIYQCYSCASEHVKKTVNISVKSGTIQEVDICQSVCGEGMFYDTGKNKCGQCDINCNLCQNGSYCYLCKSNATLVGNGKCIFSQCSPPCKSCIQTSNNCTSCQNGIYLYEHSCFSSCPRNTYIQVIRLQDSKVEICQDVTVPILYFPAVICSIVLIILVFICNSFIERGLTAKSRNHIHVLTYSSSILAYMELFALFIVLAFTVTKSSKGLCIAGLLIWMICNILFGAYYFTVMKIDEAVQSTVNKMSSASKCIYYGTLAFSIVVTLRTYRVLYCGLFRGVAPFPMKKKQSNENDALEKEQSIKKSVVGCSMKIANSDMVQKFHLQSNIKTGVISNKKDGKSKFFKSKKGTSKNQLSASVQKQHQNVQVSSKISNNPTQSENSSHQSISQHSKFQLQRPLIIYITLGSIVGSFLFLVAAVIQIVYENYIAMLFWGLDLLFVVVASIIVSCLDMWAGIKKSYLMALKKRNENQTTENIKIGEDIDENTQQKLVFSKLGANIDNKTGDDEKSPRIDVNLQQNQFKKKDANSQQNQLKSKTGKRKKVQSRYTNFSKWNRKPQQASSSSGEGQKIPDIKGFENIEMNIDGDSDYNKKSKKLKNDQKSMKQMNMRKNQNRNAMIRSNASLTRGSNLSSKFDDIFLGFQDFEGEKEFDQKTIKINNMPREIYTIRDKKIENQQKNNGGDGEYNTSSMKRIKSKQKDNYLKEGNSNMVIILQSNPQKKQQAN